MNRKEMEEKRNDLVTRSVEILNTAEAEERALTEEEAKEISEANEEVKRIRESLRLDEEVRSLENELKKKEDNTPTEEVEEVKVEERAMTPTKEEMDRMAFENYIRGELIHERAGELTPASTSAGAIIPTTIVDYIIKKVYDISPILERSQKFNVKGNLEVPFYPADSNNVTVDYRAEFTQMASTSGKFDTVELKGFLAGALTKVSRSLINNTQFDIVGFVLLSKSG